MDEQEEIKVSICCLAYNHEDYIAETIEGFLIQETDFKYEIIIHDDASTDRTANVIRKYEQNYPDLIKPIYQTTNQYSIGARISATFVYPKARGKYIAYCEGDDYWTDPKKLQKQFDCLEKNPDAVCCYHGDYILDPNGLRKESRIPPKYRHSYTSYEMMTGQTYISPLTSFFRNVEILIDYPWEADYVKNGDTFLYSILGQYGGGIYLTDIEPAIYRVHEGGIWSMKSNQERKAMALNTWFWLAQYYSRVGNQKVEDSYRIRYIIGGLSGLGKKHTIKLLGNLVSNFIRNLLSTSKKEKYEKV